MLKAIDLFSGCGGLTLGLKGAGFDVLAAIEIDNLAFATYKLNHSQQLKRAQNIVNVRPPKLMAKLGLKPGDLHLLAGCPPCQGFSSLRTKNGALSADDPRNDLLFQFIRFAKVFQPKAIMMENVPTMARDSRFERFQAELKQLGYEGDFKILNAAEYGVPQRRKRLIFMATKQGKPRFADPSGIRKTVRDTIGTLPAPGTTDDHLHVSNEKRSDRIQLLIRMIPKDGGSRGDLPDDLQLDCHKRLNGFHDVYGRMAWDDVAPTITGGCFNPSKGRFLHPTQNRAITMREAALLQGFPPDYKFPTHKSVGDIALLIGNAFPPALVKAQALQIAGVLEGGGQQHD